MTTTTHTSARETILRKLRAGMPERPLPQPDLSDYLRGPFGVGSTGVRPDPAGLLDTFEAAALGWRAEIHRSTPGHCMEVVRDVLLQKKCASIATGAPQWSPTGWRAALDGFQRMQFDASTEAWKTALFDKIDASITVAVAAIADTGSLVLKPGPHEPRSLSLVPPVHVALVRASTLYASLPAAMSALHPQSDMPTNLLLVTGPSKTADIQQTLAYGAHGPKELVIVLVDDLAAQPEPQP